MRSRSTIHILEQALENEAELFKSLLKTLSESDSLYEFASLLSEIKNDKYSDPDRVIEDQILAVARNIKNISLALEEFYVSDLK